LMGSAGFIARSLQRLAVGCSRRRGDGRAACRTRTLVRSRHDSSPPRSASRVTAALHRSDCPFCPVPRGTRSAARRAASGGSLLAGRLAGRAKSIDASTALAPCSCSPYVLTCTGLAVAVDAKARGRLALVLHERGELSVVGEPAPDRARVDDHAPGRFDLRHVEPEVPSRPLLFGAECHPWGEDGPRPRNAPLCPRGLGPAVARSPSPALPSGAR
jgi:hypothetical protein